MAHASDDVLAFAQDRLVDCDPLISGPCIERVSSRGFIVWGDERADCMDSVIFVPGFQLMHRGVLIVAYALFFVWLFFGIAICSDIFSEAIEIITSSTRKVQKKHPHTGETIIVEEKVWNWVVANISLMAFGTSAPEILLSVVETLTQLGSKGGQLGASTILGSAAYNYFVIPGVCSAALPAGEFRKLEHIYVFVCTAIWSVWAYIWMYITLSVISPNEVEVWEGVVTFIFFPAMLIVAYAVDKKPWALGWRFCRKVAPCAKDLEEQELSRVASLASAIDGDGGKAISQMEGSSKLESSLKGSDGGIYAPQSTGAPRTGSATGGSIAPGQRRSILHYRNLAVRWMAGESKTPEMLAASRGQRSPDFHDEISLLSGRFVEHAKREEAAPEGATKLGFGSLHYSVLEAQGAARVAVRRYDGDLDMPISVSFATRDGTAIAGIDYKSTSGVLKFLPGEVEKEIEIGIIDDDMSEPDVSFSVVLSDLKGLGVVIVQDSVSVTIVDDDDSGMITFELPTKEACVVDSYVSLPVLRRNGADGRVTVDYSTKDGTGPAAVAGHHYKETKGTLVFENGETHGVIRIPLLAIGNNRMLVFKAELSNPLGGAVLGKRTVCRVIITPGGKLSKSKSTKKDLKGSHEEGEEEEEEEFNLWEGYRENYKEAIMPELEDGADFVWFDLMLHYISITWKLICAIIPPVGWLGAYPAFVGSLVILVGIIYLTKEVANVLGCELTLSPVMTGLSLVAFGTSLPDTFASRMAAVHDDTADAAIGNITGSNSTNVFLGLGLPWIIAAAFYRARGEKFIVPAGDLGFSLVLWCAGFGAMSIVFFIRRRQGGELGGSLPMQRLLLAWALFLWIFFLVLSGVHDYNHFESNLQGGSA